MTEALEIIQMGEMKLHLIDYHIEAGKLHQDQLESDEAKKHFETATRLIEETGCDGKRESLNYMRARD